jgi:hypothetical protein
MLKKSMILLGSLLVATSLCLAQEKTDPQPVVKKTPIKQTSAASGKEMYSQYCAPCHGSDGKGAGPAASSMKTMPTEFRGFRTEVWQRPRFPRLGRYAGLGSIVQVIGQVPRIRCAAKNKQPGELY